MYKSICIFNKQAQGNTQHNFVTVYWGEVPGPVKELESMSLIMAVPVAY